MNKELICIICPRGCKLDVNAENGEAKVKGNFCPKGEAYGEEEVIAPKRTVNSVVRVGNSVDTMVSVKSSVPVLKSDVFKVMDAIRRASVSAPVKMGDVVLKDICGTNVVATKAIL